jgi:hypothetical protein
MVSSFENANSPLRDISLRGSATLRTFTVDKRTVYTYWTTKPITNTKLLPSCGIAMIYCGTCDKRWALQWSHSPANIFPHCKNINSELWDGYGAQKTCEKCQNGPEKGTDVNEGGNGKNAVEKGCPQRQRKNFDSAKVAASIDQVVSSAKELSLADAAEAAKAKVFEDVLLSPPAPTTENALEKEVDWDVVEPEDANEDWAVINHFGSVARCHGDAHVDTECVSP